MKYDYDGIGSRKIIVFKCSLKKRYLSLFSSKLYRKDPLIIQTVLGFFIEHQFCFHFRYALMHISSKIPLPNRSFKLKMNKKGAVIKLQKKQQNHKGATPEKGLANSFSGISYKMPCFSFLYRNLI